MLVSLLLGHGHSGEGGHTGDVGHAGDGGHAGHDAHAQAPVEYGVQGGGHGSASAGPANVPAFQFPFFSPLALATLFGAIGAFGLIVQQGFGASDGTSLTIALPAACVTAYLVTYAGWRLVSGSRGSSQIRAADLEGAYGEVITPIPAGGVGEVAAMVDGQRFSSPAREVDGKEVPRGAQVRVRTLVGATLLVEKKEG